MEVTETFYSKFVLFFTKLDWAKRSLLIAAVQTVFLSILEFIILAKLIESLSKMFGFQSGTYGIVTIYAVIFALSLWFNLFLTADAWVFKNTMQSTATAVFNASIFIYSCVQIKQLYSLRNCGLNFVNAVNFSDPLSTSYFIAIHQNSSECPSTDAFKTIKSTQTAIINNRTQIIPLFTNIREGYNQINAGLNTLDVCIGLAFTIMALMLIFTLIGVFTSFKVYQEYGWILFHEQGASIKKRDILRRYHLHILFQKLNIFFSLGVILQIVGIIYYGHKQVSQSSSEALEQTWAAVTSFSSDSNIVIASFVIFFGGIAGTLLGYFGTKKCNYVLMSFFLLTIATNIAAVVYAMTVVLNDPRYKNTVVWFTVFSLLTLILNTATAINAFMVMFDFSQGLFEILNTSKEEIELRKTRRMELD